jgi:hypothetical protein
MLFLIVVVLGVSIGLLCMCFGRLMGGVLPGQASHGPSPVEKWRLQMKADGLVLHMPSYREGIEAYVEPRWEHLPQPTVVLTRL